MEVPPDRRAPLAERGGEAAPSAPDALPRGPAGSFRWLRLVAYAAVALVVVSWLALGVRALLGCAARSGPGAGPRAPAAPAEP